MSCREANTSLWRLRRRNARKPAPESLLQADAELARLLRGMALIKAAIVVAALAALLWRFGQP